jgi:hypothetical protein
MMPAYEGAWGGGEKACVQCTLVMTGGRNTQKLTFTVKCGRPFCLRGEGTVGTLGVRLLMEKSMIAMCSNLHFLQ